MIAANYSQSCTLQGSSQTLPALRAASLSREGDDYLQMKSGCSLMEQPLVAIIFLL